MCMVNVKQLSNILLGVVYVFSKQTLQIQFQSHTMYRDI